MIYEQEIDAFTSKFSSLHEYYNLKINTKVMNSEKNTMKAEISSLIAFTLQTLNIDIQKIKKNKTEQKRIIIKTINDLRNTIEEIYPNTGIMERESRLKWLLSDLNKFTTSIDLSKEQTNTNPMGNRNNNFGKYLFKPTPTHVKLENKISQLKEECGILKDESGESLETKKWDKSKRQDILKHLKELHIGISSYFYENTITEENAEDSYTKLVTLKNDYKKTIDLIADNCEKAWQYDLKNLENLKNDPPEPWEFSPINLQRAIQKNNKKDYKTIEIRDFLLEKENIFHDSLQDLEKLIEKSKSLKPAFNKDNLEKYKTKVLNNRLKLEEIDNQIKSEKFNLENLQHRKLIDVIKKIELLIQQEQPSPPTNEKILNILQAHGSNINYKECFQSNTGKKIALLLEDYKELYFPDLDFEDMDNATAISTAESKKPAFDIDKITGKAPEAFMLEDLEEIKDEFKRINSLNSENINHNEYSKVINLIDELNDFITEKEKNGRVPTNQEIVEILEEKTKDINFSEGFSGEYGKELAFFMGRFKTIYFSEVSFPKIDKAIQATFPRNDIFLKYHKFHGLFRDVMTNIETYQNYEDYYQCKKCD